MQEIERKRHVRLLAWLAEHGMSQRALADAIGVHETAVSQVVSGERQPSAGVRLAFAKRYGLEETQRIFDSECQEQPA